MSSNERDLPLFPLNTVLFPACYLPLQIFEDRYKLMLQDCSQSDDTFGVVLIKSGNEVGEEPAEPYNVGTTAKIIQRSPISGGRIFVSVFGQQCFEIQKTLQQHPYIIGRVKVLDEGSRDDVSSQLVEEVRDRITEYVRTLTGLAGGWINKVEMPDDPLALSYFVGGTLRIGPLEKQRLLEAHPMAYRLMLESEVIQQETQELKQLSSEDNRSRRFSQN